MLRYINHIVVAVSLIAFIFMLATNGWIAAFGWVYSLAFAFSALPQAIRSWKDGHSRGVADGTLILWMVGEVAGIVYGIGLMQAPIIFNCLLNTILVGIIVYYRLKPREIT